jgi:2'-5' RNA ligase
MKYLTVFLIKGPAGEFQRKTLYELAEKFSIGGAIQRDPPSHLTLKYSFETEDISEVEAMIKKFCKNHAPTKLKLEGFSHFDNNVIFIKATPSMEMRQIHHELLKEFHKISWMKWHEHDKENFNFHASVAHTDIAKKFGDIWSYLKKYTPKYDLEWNNITLFKLVDGKWIIHKKFQIRKNKVKN